MSSVYPSALDGVPANKTDDMQMALDHAAHHNFLALAINNIEAELGTDPSGIYATVRDRFNAAPIYPEQNGAIGDGITNDTVAVQNSWNAAVAAKKPLILTPGKSYVVDSLVVPGSGARIIAYGSTLKHSVGAQNPVIYYAIGNPVLDSLVIDGVTFSGNGVDARTTVNGTQNGLVNGALLVGSTAGFTSSGSFSVANDYLGGQVYNYTSKDATHFYGVTGSFTGGYKIHQGAIKAGIYVTGIDNVRIVNNRIDGFMSAGIVCDGCRQFWISDNIVTNCTHLAGRNAIHVDVDYNNTADATKPSNGYIARNYVDAGNAADGGAGGIVPTIQTTNSALRIRLLVTQNIVKNFVTWAGIAFEAGWSQSAIISQNQVYNSLLGITIDQNSAFAGQEENNIVISGNHIDSTGLATAKGIFVQGSDIAVGGNVVRSAGDGISVVGVDTVNKRAENVTVVGNAVKIANTSTSALPAGIVVNQARNVLVADNTITRETDRTLSGMGHGIYSQSSIGVRISNNQIRNAGITGIYTADWKQGEISHNTILDPNSQQNFGSGIIIDNFGGVGAVDLIRILNNFIIVTGAYTQPDYGIRSTSTNNTKLSLVGNHLDNVSGGISVASAASVIQDRDNYVNGAGNGGTSTTTPGAGVTTFVIAHGLRNTPTQYSVIPGGANSRGLGAYYVTADATNITITVTTATAAATAYNWVWSARV